MRVKLDWREYYKNFKATHGDPVLAFNRLLFRDGWMYNAEREEGPEFPPPTETNKLNRLIWTYWNKRRLVVRDELRELQAEVTALRELQSVRSETLQQRVKDPDQGASVIVPLKVEDLQGRVKWLQEDFDICNSKLEELREWREQNPMGMPAVDLEV